MYRYGVNGGISRQLQWNGYVDNVRRNTYNIRMVVDMWNYRKFSSRCTVQCRQWKHKSYMNTSTVTEEKSPDETI